MTVISNESKLNFHWVPEKLMHRSKQMEALHDMLLSSINGLSTHALVYGKTGTGKTVTAKKVCQDICSKAHKERKNMEWHRINCMENRSERQILNELFRKAKVFTLQPDIAKLREHLIKNEKHILLILDDADAFIERNESLIYSLTRIAEDLPRQTYGLSLILITHRNLLHKMNESTLSTFGHNVVPFPPYNKEELIDIIRQRVKAAFKPHAVQEDSIHLIADIASHYGDARFAIELLLKAGKACDKEGMEEVKPEHVRAAKAITYSFITESKLRYLPRQEKIVLLAISRKLEDNAYITTSEAEESYKLACEEYGDRARAHTQFYNYLKNLEKEGFIELNITHVGGTTHKISIPDIPVSILQKKLEELLLSPYAYV